MLRAKAQEQLPRALVELIPESDAAAYACIEAEGARRDVGRVMVYDAGAGTLDVSLFRCAEGGVLQLLYRHGLRGCGNQLTQMLARTLDLFLAGGGRVTRRVSGEDEVVAYDYLHRIVATSDEDRVADADRREFVRAMQELWVALESWKKELPDLRAAEDAEVPPSRSPQAPGESSRARGERGW